MNAAFKPWTTFFYGTQVNVTDNELAAFPFFVKFYKLFVFKKGDSTSALSSANN